MIRKKTVVMMLSLVLLIVTGCANKPYGHYKDNEMIGFVESVDVDEQTINFDISEWTKRDISGPNMNDWGAGYTAKLTKSTIVEDESGNPVNWQELKSGQKVQIIPPKTSNDTPKKLLVLEMSKHELYKRAGLLANNKGTFRTTVIDVPGGSNKLSNTVLGMKLEGGVNVGGSYDSNQVLDVKKEFEVESLPVILVFDTDKLVLKTERLEEFKKFMEEHKE
ncbi:hypothetical protein ACFO9Q_20510 [Paenibacillus sp. GCM10023252]|uniref:hypothetical protein n=1 Tax=Paenibacillus sp. GCM10023252 TaxID=3252649 RepID=UPI00360C5314